MRLPVRTFLLLVGLIALLAPRAVRAIDEYRLDDGVKEIGIGVQSTGSNSFAWLNRFVVQPGLETISAVRVVYGGGALQTNIGNGQPLTLYVWADPNQDGDPSDAFVLASVPGTVDFTGTNAFNTYTLPAPLTLTAGQIIFAGGIVNYSGQVLVGSLDRDGTDSIPPYLPNDQSFVASSGNGVPVNPGALNLAQLPVASVRSAIFAGNDDATWMIRLNALVTGAAVLSITPNPIDFGLVDVGTIAGPRSATLTSGGTLTLSVFSIGAPGAPFQNAPGGTCPATPFLLPPGLDCTVVFDFAPTVPGAVAQTLAIVSNAATSPDDLVLTGTGGGPLPVLTPAGIDFGAIDIGALSPVETMLVLNAGTAPWNVTGLSTPGPPPPAYIVLMGSCGPFPFVLAPGQSCDLQFVFAPVSHGLHVQSYELIGNAPPGSARFQLRGVGTLFDDGFD